MRCWQSPYTYIWLDADMMIDNGTAIAGVSSDNTLIICHDGDNICEHGDLILLPHLTYLEDADTAAEFVVSQL